MNAQHSTPDACTSSGVHSIPARVFVRCWATGRKGDRFSFGRPVLSKIPSASVALLIILDFGFLYVPKRPTLLLVLPLLFHAGGQLENLQAVPMGFGHT